MDDGEIKREDRHRQPLEIERHDEQKIEGGDPCVDVVRFTKEERTIFSKKSKVKISVQRSFKSMSLITTNYYMSRFTL
ncbi:hypothetical protein TSUD_329930 [Trifolium subterraneum]|nr:hypothetical protein TSUD_329930 [Trifolium subterraneum]